MIKFQYEQTTKIVFERGCINKLPEMAARFGQRVLLVTGNKKSSRSALYQRILSSLQEKGLTVEHYDGVIGNPTTDCVDAGVAVARNTNAEVVIGVGGGSVMDSAKAIALCAVNPGSAWDYLFFKEKSPKVTLPVIAVPTTSGTGSQVTQVAVMTETSTRTKSAIFNNLIYPKIALIDPDLSASMPPHITASTGFDAFCHCFESYLNVNGSPYTDMIALEGIRYVATFLKRAVKDGSDSEAREGMAWADTCGGLAIANAGVTLPHGVGMMISGHCPEVLHGESLALLYPSFTRFTMPHAISKFAAVGRILNPALSDCSEEDAARACCDEIDNLLKEIGMWLDFRQFQVGPELLKEIAERGHELPDYKANPVIADENEIYRELMEAYDR